MTEASRIIAEIGRDRVRAALGKSLRRVQEWEADGIPGRYLVPLEKLAGRELPRSAFVWPDVKT